MCLDIKRNTVIKTANKNIICYKALKNKKVPVLTNLNSGDEFSGFIKNIHCTGHISIVDNTLFLCTDDDRIDGDYCSEKYGHNFSWSFDKNVGVININNELLKLNNVLITPYRNFSIEIGNTYESELSGNECEIHRGLHSFANLEEAKKCFQNDLEVIFIECIIPKGSSYYKGTFDHSISYASNKLTYTKPIKI